MRLEAITFCDVFASRNDSQVALNVEAGDAATSQRDDVVDVEPATAAVEPITLRINGLDRFGVGPRRDALSFSRSTLGSIGKRLDMVVATQGRRFVVPAARGIWAIADPDTLTARSAASERLSVILFAEPASAHQTHPRNSAALPHNLAASKQSRFIESRA